MKKMWNNAEITELEIQATELAEQPNTGVDESWMGEDGRMRYREGVAYNSGSAKNLTLTGPAAEHWLETHE